MPLVHIIISIGVLLLLNSAHAGDWSSCESGLTGAGRMARDAAEIAADLESLESDLEDLKDEYESCLQFPDVYDLMEDGCIDKRDEYNDKVREYNSRLAEFSSQLNDFVSRTKRALSEC